MQPAKKKSENKNQHIVKLKSMCFCDYLSSLMNKKHFFRSKKQQNQKYLEKEHLNQKLKNMRTSKIFLRICLTPISMLLAYRYLRKQIREILFKKSCMYA